MSVLRINSTEEIDTAVELDDLEPNEKKAFLLKDEEIFQILSFMSRFTDIVLLSRLNKTWNKCSNDKKVYFQLLTF